MAPAPGWEKKAEQLAKQMVHIENVLSNRWSSKSGFRMKEARSAHLVPTFLCVRRQTHRCFSESPVVKSPEIQTPLSSSEPICKNASNKAEDNLSGSCCFFFFSSGAVGAKTILVVWQRLGTHGSTHVHMENVFVTQISYCHTRCDFLKRCERPHHK